jgi:hypothetical protein
MAWVTTGERKAKEASGLMTIIAYNATSTIAGMKRGSLRIRIILLLLSSGYICTSKLLELVQLRLSWLYRDNL